MVKADVRICALDAVRTNQLVRRKSEQGDVTEPHGSPPARRQPQRQSVGPLFIHRLLPEVLVQQLLDTPLLLPIPDACRRLGVGRTTLYGLLSDGRLQSVHVNTKRLVVARSIDRYVGELVEASAPAA